MKTITPHKDKAAAALDFLIRYAQRNRGTIHELTARLSARTGRPIFRQCVEQWLHPDPAKRVEPKLGVGLLLIHEGRKLLSKAKTGRGTRTVPKRVKPGGI